MSEKKTYYRYSIIYLTLLFLFLLSIIFLSSPEAADGLRAHWKFDENNSNIAYDSAGTNNGTIYGTTAWETGIRGSCIHFDGSSGYVLIPDDDVLDPTSGDITIEAWIKSDTMIGNFCEIVSKRRCAYTRQMVSYRSNKRGGNTTSYIY